MVKEKTRSFSFLAVAVISLVVVLVLASGFVLWASSALGPDSTALAALNSSPTVEVVSNMDWITFQPATSMTQTAFIFYPGGKVEFRSYAPALRRIAEAGYLVVLPNMPLNLAFLSPDKAAKIIKSFPEVINWVIGGHSLGGSMAAMYAATHPEQIKGLVLWASYPSGMDNLHDTGLKVLMVFGTQDGLVSRSELDEARLLLPVDTFWMPIEGGNHAQFGDYGAQPGDKAATIDAMQQQNMAVKATLEFLSGISK